MGIAKKSSIDFATQIGIVFVSGVAGIIVARFLHVEGYGAFKLVLLANTLSLNMTNLGLSIANTYFIGKDERYLPEAHTISVVLACFFTFILFVLLMLVGDFLRQAFFKDIPVQYLLIAIGLLPFSLYYAVWTGILIGLGRIVLLSVFNFTYQFIQATGFILLLVVFRQHLIALIISWAAIQVGAVFVMMFLLKRYYKKIFAPLNFHLLKKFMRFGFTAYFGNVASNLLTRIDMLIVSSFLGVGSVGLYSIAGTTLAEKLWLIAAAMEKASYSSVISADKQDAVFLIKKIERNTLFLSFCAAVFLFIIAPWVVPFLYGSEYAPSAGLLRIFLAGTVIYGGSRIFAMYFTGFKGKPQIPTAIAWVMFTINAVLCYILTRTYGIWGAVSATVCSYLVMFSIYLVLFVREAGIKDLRPLLLINREDIKTYFTYARKGLRQALSLLR